MRIRRDYTIFMLFLLFILSFSVLNASNVFADIIIDNGASGTSYTGTWGVSSGTSPYGANSLWARDGATYTWQFSSQPAGVYEVYMWWSGYSSRATNIAVTINTSSGSKVVNINQQQNAGKWNTIGQYTFNSSGSVKITAANGSTVSTCADAVKFVYVPSGGNTPPTAYITSISPNPSTVGQSIQFQGQGTDSDGSVVAYQWDSNIDGLLSNSASFTTLSLSTGTHTISFKVQDNGGAWSSVVTQTLVVGNVPTTEIIIDNGASGTSYTGTWGVSGGTSPYGANSLWARDGATYTWQFSSQPAGVYEVYMWWSGYSSRATNIAVTINTSSGSKVVNINQQQNAGKWNSLGQHTFNSSGSVKITAANGSTVSTCADAVRFVYVSGGGNAFPTAYIDSISPNPAMLGQTVTFSGSGTDSDGTIAGYSWRSSVDGLLSTSATFSTKTLSEGHHTIYFKVQDNKGSWSPEVSKTIDVNSQVSNTEHIYFCLLYFWDIDKADLISTLKGIGAHQDGDVWKYTNSSLGKDYVIHIVEDIESMKQALYTENAHVILKGHSNYGLGGVFVPDYAHIGDVTNNIFYIDDDKIFNYSSPWIAVSVKGMIESQAYPKWWPIFKDKTSGIMPFDFGDPKGDPPYNYYVTYQVPSDPTYYQVRGTERFPDSGKPAWYSPDGAYPNPANPNHQQFYITNPNASVDPNRLCGGRICPPVHYGSKTILFRKGLEVDINQLKYKRMLYDACNTANYYLDTFHRGLMFYTVDGSGTYGSFRYLQAYLQGKTDEQIWEILQAYQPVYDYYDFNKLPSEQ